MVLPIQCLTSEVVEVVEGCEYSLPYLHSATGPAMLLAGRIAAKLRHVLRVTVISAQVVCR